MQGVDKIFYPLDGKPLIAYSLSVLNAHPRVGEVALVVGEHSIARAKSLVSEYGYRKVRHVRKGGVRRQDSVRHGIDALGTCDLVVVHDGARPFLDAAMLNAGIAAAADYGAAIAAVPVKDTVKYADAATTVTQTVPREGLWAVQTPQVFRYDLLARAHHEVHTDVTDDASMVEAIGHSVRLYMGSYYNIKVTTPEDLTLAQAILHIAKNAHPSAKSDGAGIPREREV